MENPAPLNRQSYLESILSGSVKQMNSSTDCMGRTWTLINHQEPTLRHSYNKQKIAAGHVYKKTLSPLTPMGAQHYGERTKGLPNETWNQGSVYLCFTVDSFVFHGNMDLEVLWMCTMVSPMSDKHTSDICATVSNSWTGWKEVISTAHVVDRNPCPQQKLRISITTYRSFLISFIIALYKVYLWIAVQSIILLYIYLCVYI